MINLRCEGTRRSGFGLASMLVGCSSGVRFASVILLTSFIFESAKCQQPPRPESFAPKAQIAVESGSSVGNIHICCFAADRRLSLFEVEYDRRWAHFLGSEFDYVGALIPLVVVNEPAKYGVDSLPLTTARQNHYGVGFSPTGARFKWRPESSFSPYLVAKGGIMYFPSRILSAESSKLDFFAQYGGGMETALASTARFRLEFNIVHISDGNIARRNPGIDFMYINAGIALPWHGFSRSR